jgi:hypothetical protein
LLVRLIRPGQMEPEGSEGVEERIAKSGDVARVTTRGTNRQVLSSLSPHSLH